MRVYTNPRLEIHSPQNRRTGKFQKSVRTYWPFYVMALPAILYLIINNYIPMGGIIIAFKDYNVRKGIWGSPWAGLNNFRYLFMTSDAWVITRNTIFYNLVFIVLGTSFSVFISILLGEIVRKSHSKFFQTVVLLPYLISIIIVSYIVYAFLSMDTGLLNSFLKRAGHSWILWYAEPKYWPFILTFVHIWKSFGFNTIIYYATIVGIDSTYYEAARIDGASKLQEIFHITLPGLKSTIVIMTILAIGRIFYSDFGLFYQVPMNSGSLFPTTNVIDTYVYRALFNMGDYGMSSAASFYQSVIGFLLVVGANAIVRKIDSENAMF